jgi:acyl-CoA thioesterase FadM
MPRHSLSPSLADVRQLPLTHAAVIPEDYLDAMGHMNVMWYTHLFSLATTSIFKLFGMTWEEIRARDGGTFALESHIRYLSEVRVGQSVEVRTRLLGRSEKRVHVLHFLTNADKQDVSATFEVVIAYVNLRTRRMAPIPAEITARIDPLIEQHAALPWPSPVCGVMGA